LKEVVFRPEAMRSPQLGFQIRVKDLIKMFPKLKPKEDKYCYIEFTVEESSLGVKIQDKGISFRLPVWELTPAPKELPDPKIPFFKAEIHPLSIKSLVDAIEQLKSITDYVILSVENNRFKVSGKGEHCEKTIELPCSDMVSEGDLKASYNLNQRSAFLKTLNKRGGSTVLKCSSEKPLWIYAECSYKDSPLERISYYLAPRMER